MAEGEPTRAFIELHGGDAKVEDDAVDRLVAAVAHDRLKVREIIFNQGEAVAGRACEIGAARDRVRIAVDGDDVTVRRSQNCAAVAASSEGRIHVDFPGADVEEFDHGAAEHGNVTSQSASDSARAVAARHHSRAPCGPSAATREPSCRLSARTFSVASASSARKRAGSQI